MFKMERAMSGITERTKVILAADNITVTLGDVIGLLAATEGVASNSDTAIYTSGAKILGVVVGFTDSLNEVITTGTNPAAQTSVSTGTAKATYLVYQPIAGYEWRADLSAASGTTTGSNVAYTFFTMQSGTPGTILESSVAAVGAAGTYPSGSQFMSLGIPADNTSQIIVVCINSYVPF